MSLSFLLREGILPVGWYYQARFCVLQIIDFEENGNYSVDLQKLTSRDCKYQQTLAPLVCERIT